MNSIDNHYQGAESLQALALGKATEYTGAYDPSLLQAVPRQLNRSQLALTDDDLPFKGGDIWTGYELSWLNSKGKPQVAVGEFVLPCESPDLVESKSFKLYLNSFNQTRFAGWTEVAKTMQRDLTGCAGAPVKVRLIPLEQLTGETIAPMQGILLDDLDIEISEYDYDPEQLQADPSQQVEETLVSHLLKSNCLITGQPDWGSVQIHYRGAKLDHQALLRYLIGFRQHNEFHEQCVERIFCDLLKVCAPSQLTVYARYTRRGGLDINPYRSNHAAMPRNIRMARQ